MDGAMLPGMKSIEDTFHCYAGFPPFFFPSPYLLEKKRPA